MASKQASALAATPVGNINDSKKSPKTLLDTFDPRTTKELYNLKPHAITGRLIDSHPGTRTVPMRVLCLGMSRTGTMAIFTALQQLGFNPYHMAVAIGSPRTNLDLWREGLEAKYYGKGKKWGREEFDKLLGAYDGIADVPGICFVEELVAAYPDAKVIVTNRDVESWLQSMDSTGGRVARWWTWPWIAPWDPNLALPFWEHAKVVLPAFFGTMTDFSSSDTPARQKFKEYYERVYRTVPKEKMLEFKLEDGWGPLCEYLDVPVPEEEFPRINDAKQFVFVHGMMWYLAVAKMTVKIGLMAAVPAIGIGVAWWWRNDKL